MSRMITMLTWNAFELKFIKLSESTTKDHAKYYIQ